MKLIRRKAKSVPEPVAVDPAEPSGEGSGLPVQDLVSYRCMRCGFSAQSGTLLTCYRCEGSELHNGQARVV